MVTSVDESERASWLESEFEAYCRSRARLRRLADHVDWFVAVYGLERTLVYEARYLRLPEDEHPPWYGDWHECAGDFMMAEMGDYISENLAPGPTWTEWMRRDEEFAEPEGD